MIKSTEQKLLAECKANGHPGVPWAEKIQGTFCGMLNFTELREVVRKGIEYLANQFRNKRKAYLIW